MAEGNVRCASSDFYAKISYQSEQVLMQCFDQSKFEIEHWTQSPRSIVTQ
eukprot:SAG31_NODE_2836_length_5019_cov_2.059350_8_plen_50_part_00